MPIDRAKYELNIFTFFYCKFAFAHLSDSHARLQANNSSDSFEQGCWKKEGVVDFA